MASGLPYGCFTEAHDVPGPSRGSGRAYYGCHRRMAAALGQAAALHGAAVDPTCIQRCWMLGALLMQLVVHDDGRMLSGRPGGWLNRAWYVFSRSRQHLDEIVLGVWGNTSVSGEKNFKDSYRMCFGTFTKLCYVLDPYLRPKGNAVWEAIPVRAQVLIGLSRLASGNSPRDIAALHGYAKSTVSKITKRFCRALVAVKGRFIIVPITADEWNRVAAG